MLLVHNEQQDCKLCIPWYISDLTITIFSFRKFYCLTFHR